ncbi:hypothetical protein F7725_012243 [Dissostichus mawsoni]|uniref:Uncharacterized protein n=1 Tax=Dissostichus mawsoni TaxID=36200 RepID=A0A7J5YNF1_DISMA|nr:hypothetical protein F7725_012243 [Dissostichus mawsoni]
MFQYLIIQSVEQQHVSVPYHSVSGTTTCFSPSSFSQWNNNMFQSLIIQSVEQQHVSVPHHSLTCDGDGEQTALRGQVLRKSRDVINTAVVSLVGGLCSREQEVGRVIDSWLGVVVSGGAQQEGASWVLRLDGATDGEGGASEHLEPLLLGPGDPVHGGGHRDVGLKQLIWREREMEGEGEGERERERWRERERDGGEREMGREREMGGREREMG